MKYPYIGVYTLLNLLDCIHKITIVVSNQHFPHTLTFIIIFPSDIGEMIKLHAIEKVELASSYIRLCIHC